MNSAAILPEDLNYNQWLCFYTAIMVSINCNQQLVNNQLIGNIPSSHKKVVA